MSHEDDRKKRRSARKEPEESPTRRDRQRPKTRPPETSRQALKDENRRMREALKQSGKAKQGDYQALAMIMKSDLDPGEKLLQY